MEVASHLVQLYTAMHSTGVMLVVGVRLVSSEHNIKVVQLKSDSETGPET